MAWEADPGVKYPNLLLFGVAYPPPPLAPSGEPC